MLVASQLGGGWLRSARSARRRSARPNSRSCGPLAGRLRSPGTERAAGAGRGRRTPSRRYGPATAAAWSGRPRRPRRSSLAHGRRALAQSPAWSPTAARAAGLGGAFRGCGGGGAPRRCSGAEETPAHGAAAERSADPRDGSAGGPGGRRGVPGGASGRRGASGSRGGWRPAGRAEPGGDPAALQPAHQRGAGVGRVLPVLRLPACRGRRPPPAPSPRALSRSDPRLEGRRRHPGARRRGRAAPRCG